MSLEKPLSSARRQAHEKSETVREEVVAAEKRAILSEHRADDFDSVLLIASASRGGSSLLFDTLRHHEGTCSPDGEHGKWYTFNGVCYPEFDSDRVPTDFDDFDREALLTDLLADVGATTADGDRTHRIDDALVRLPLQFPERDLPYGEMRESMLDGP